MSKSIDTIIPDIEHLFEGHQCDPGRVDALGRELAEMVASRLLDYNEPRTPTLRMSNLGKPDRQLWYQLHLGLPQEELSPSTKFKFLYGDVIESLVLFLAEEAGHNVENRQGEVEVGGIKGHIDAVIDGVLIDVKSASTHAYRKFKTNSVSDDDPFGYVDQLAGYAFGLGGLEAAWIAADKQNGHLCLSKLPEEELGSIDVPARVEHVKAVLASDEVPERCYEPVEDGKSGNLALPVGCSYCSFKHHCYVDSNEGIGLRTFLYSTGPKHLIHVAREPNVPELTF